MKKEYWDVTDAQVVEKTGHPLGHWMRVLTAFDAAAKPSDPLRHSARFAAVIKSYGMDPADFGVRDIAPR